MIDGMGIVFYSPKTNKNIPKGYNFLDEEYSNPENVAKHRTESSCQRFL